MCYVDVNICERTGIQNSEPIVEDLQEEPTVEETTEASKPAKTGKK